MKQVILAVFNAFFVGGAFAVTAADFQINGGRPIQIQSSDKTGVVIPITLTAYNPGDVVLTFATFSTLNMAACQLTFPANSAGQTKNIVVYPASDVTSDSILQIAMTIYAASVAGAEGGPCTTATKSIF